ncbi:MAG: phenylacetate-CoA oxygenase subunit PaaJ [Flavobacteriales bacterium]|nr:phenylacetate-CoA oxygenase subunit PaaJ [Flavobacteriales bacterium]
MNEFQIRELLEEVKDPEVPVLSVLDLGVVRSVSVVGNVVDIVLTPTYSGCPAMKVIEDDIVSILKANGIETVTIEMVLAPAWTTDWITEKGKQQLKEFGIAPPEKSSVDKSSITGDAKFIRCPQCNSENTEMISQFGSTACKALYKCLDCLEPFDYFKCL